MRRALALAAATAAVAVPCAASARATVALDGGSLAFFADTLALVARDGATLALADGTRGRADAAYVDLRNDRAVLAGHAHVAHGGAARDADAIVVDLDDPRVDLLDAASGVTETTRALGAPKAASFDAARFAFPDVDDRNAFIRSKRARITPHADVRFTPASFPTSVGGVPVPSYLYTYATAIGFSSNSLPGASFDQPYGLWGSPTSLTALHARWEEGIGPALGLQQQLVSGDDAYANASIDQPLHGYSVRSFNAYRRMGARYTVEVDGTDTIYGALEHMGLTAAFGAGGRALRLLAHVERRLVDDGDAAVARQAAVRGRDVPRQHQRRLRCAARRPADRAARLPRLCDGVAARHRPVARKPDDPRTVRRDADGDGRRQPHVVRLSASQRLALGLGAAVRRR